MSRRAAGLVVLALAAVGGNLVTVPAAWAQAPAGSETVSSPVGQPVTLIMPRITFDATPTSGAQSGGAASSKVFNPDISVIGNFVGTFGRNEFNEEPPFQLSEVEFAFQAVVDPYSRADFYVAVGPDGVDIEEGFITFTALPANLLLKVGKLRAQFGKMNTMHTHRLPSVDRPLVTENLVGGEEGLSDAGLSVSHLIPNAALFIELTGEVYAARSEVFNSPKNSRLNYLGRARAYRDLTEATNLDVGFSYAYGPTDVGFVEPADGDEMPVLSKDLYGIDVTLRYRPLRRAIYRRLNLRTELIWSRQELDVTARTTAFGFYALGEYQFARRWYVGGRMDRSGRALDGALVDTGGSVFFTFWPTEFSQIRGQYRYTRYAEDVAGNEFLVQFNFSIGAHGAHVF
jgi:hypothetical protein